MPGYIVYWAKDYVSAVKKSGDKGPLKVVYGSPHTVMPYITSVKVGDIIYPVTVQNGTLAVMARLPVERIEPAFEYTVRELGRRFSALVPEGAAYYTKGKFGEFVCLEHGCGYVTGKFTYFSEREKTKRVFPTISPENTGNGSWRSFLTASRRCRKPAAPRKRQAESTARRSIRVKSRSTPQRRCFSAKPKPL